ncbi:MAG: hypothetical protein MI861_16105, partial [Pirellulales bacterium]|nr:hypothetical protein [Pirellulales bacterium]
IRGPAEGEIATVRLHAQASASRLLQVSSAGKLRVDNLDFEGGDTTGDGGAIHVAGQLQLNGSEVRSSDANRGGGIFVADGGQAFLNGSTVAENTSTNGGAVYVDSGGTLVTINSTFAGNSASSSADAIDNDGLVSLYSSTVSANGLVASPAAAVKNGASGTFIVRNSLIADNRSTADTSGAFTSHGFNLVGNVSSATGFGVTGHLRDQVGGASGAAVLDARMGQLHRQGGRTRTMLLLPDSPAMDAASGFGMPATDQRGADRKLDGLDYNNPLETYQHVDIGATEFGTYFVNQAEDVVDSTVLADGIVDTAPSSGVQVSLRAAVQELSALAGWDGSVNPSRREMEGVIRVEPSVRRMVLDIQGSAENSSATGDLDIYGNITFRGNNQSVDAFATEVWGGWSAYPDALHFVATLPLTPLNDRLFHVMPDSQFAVENAYLFGGKSDDDGFGDNGRGGVILNDGGQLKVSGTRIGTSELPEIGTDIFGSRGNLAGVAGGAIYSRGGATELSGSIVSGGEALQGGAIYLESGTLLVDGGTKLEYNLAELDGGGIYVESGHVHITGNSGLIGNTLLYTGTGSGISIQPDGDALIDGSSRVDDNTSFHPSLSAVDPILLDGVG